MSELKKCPCGQIPEHLCIDYYNLQSSSYCCGSCCGKWHVEFKPKYLVGSGKMQVAIKAWNEVNRG